MSSEETPRPALILARIIEPVATPLTVEQQQTIFTIHKVQAVVDPYTNAELQWGALKAAILGTYYDDDESQITFGNDIDSYMSPHFYEVYVPNAKDLEMLINSFVSKMNPIPLVSYDIQKLKQPTILSKFLSKSLRRISLLTVLHYLVKREWENQILSK